MQSIRTTLATFSGEDAQSASAAVTTVVAVVVQMTRSLFLLYQFCTEEGEDTPGVEKENDGVKGQKTQLLLLPSLRYLLFASFHWHYWSLCAKPFHRLNNQLACIWSPLLEMPSSPENNMSAADDYSLGDPALSDSTNPNKRPRRLVDSSDHEFDKCTALSTLLSRYKISTMEKTRSLDFYQKYLQYSASTVASPWFLESDWHDQAYQENMSVADDYSSGDPALSDSTNPNKRPRRLVDSSDHEVQLLGTCFDI